MFLSMRSSLPPLRAMPRKFRNHLQLEASLTGRTSGRSLGTFWKTAALYRKSGSIKNRKNLLFFMLRLHKLSDMRDVVTYVSTADIFLCVGYVIRI